MEIYNFSRGINDRIFIIVDTDTNEMEFRADKYEYTRMFWQRFPEANRNDEDQLILHITDESQVTDAINLMISRGKRVLIPNPTRPDFMGMTRDKLEDQEYFYAFKSAEFDVVLDIFYDAKQDDVDFMEFKFENPCEITMYFDWEDEEEHMGEAPVTLFLDNYEEALFGEIPKAFPDMIPGFEGNLSKIDWFPRNPYRLFDLLHFLVFKMRLSYKYNEMPQPRKQLDITDESVIVLPKDIYVHFANITPKWLLKLARADKRILAIARDDRTWEKLFRRDFPYECKVYGSDIPLSYKASELWSHKQLRAFRQDLGMFEAEKWDAIDGHMPWKRWYTHTNAMKLLKPPAKESLVLEDVMGIFFDPYPIPSDYWNRDSFERFVIFESTRLPWTSGRAFRTTEIANREPIVRVIMSYYDHFMKFAGPEYPCDYDTSRLRQLFPPKDVFIPSISDYVTRMMDNYDYTVPKDAMLPQALGMWFMNPSAEVIAKRRRNVRVYLVDYIKLMVIDSICRRDFSVEKNPLIMEQIK